MVPKITHWLRSLSNSRAQECGPRGPRAGCGPRHRHGHGSHEGRRRHGLFSHGHGFGVRRPLRFLGHRLGLDDEQIGSLARILDGLKTERAQAAVDERRSSSAIADLLTSEEFSDEAATAVVEARVASAQTLAESLTGALKEVHGILNEGQRRKLATLIRGGVLSV